MKFEDLTEAQIVKAIKENDPVIVSIIFYHLKGEAKKWARGITRRSISNFEDIFIDSFVVLGTNIKGDKYELKDKFVAFFRMIFRGRLLNSLRDEARMIYDSSKVDSVEQIDETGLDAITYHEKFFCVLEKLKELPEDCQKVLEMRFFEGLKGDEIAKIMDYTYDYCRRKIYKCLMRLRNKCKDC